MGWVLGLYADEAYLFFVAVYEWDFWQDQRRLCKESCITSWCRLCILQWLPKWVLTRKKSGLLEHTTPLEIWLPQDCFCCFCRQDSVWVESPLLAVFCVRIEVFSWFQVMINEFLHETGLKGFWEHTARLDLFAEWKIWTLPLCGGLFDASFVCCRVAKFYQTQRDHMLKSAQKWLAGMTFHSRNSVPVGVQSCHFWKGSVYCRVSLALRGPRILQSDILMWTSSFFGQARQSRNCLRESCTCRHGGPPAQRGVVLSRDHVMGALSLYTDQAYLFFSSVRKGRSQLFFVSDTYSMSAVQFCFKKCWCCCIYR